jgi:hypothetical protein
MSNCVTTGFTGARQVCPTCHRPTKQFRLGLLWPLLKCRILDVLIARGELGASAEDIINSAYNGRKQPKPTCIKSHIQQIRDVLAVEESPWRIARDGNRWELRRRRRGR